MNALADWVVLPFLVIGTLMAAVLLFGALGMVVRAAVGGLMDRAADRDEAELARFELGRRDPGAVLAAADDRGIWSEDTLRLPPHAAGPLSPRRRDRKRLHRDIDLMLCHAAVRRPQEDA